MDLRIEEAIGFLEAASARLGPELEGHEAVTEPGLVQVEAEAVVVPVGQGAREALAELVELVAPDAQDVGPGAGAEERARQMQHLAGLHAVAGEAG